MEEQKGVCTVCGKDTEGYKCDTCGAESATHDPNHECGGEHCMQKCGGCGEAETNCACDEEAA